MVAATLLVSGRQGGLQQGGLRLLSSTAAASNAACWSAAADATAALPPAPPLPAAVGLALPYTPVGALEGMVALPPSFYAWVAAMIAGAACGKLQ